MAQSFTIKIENAGALARALSRAPAIMTKYLNRALDASAIAVFDEREKEVPKDTGQLSATMQWKRAGLSARIFPTKEYAEFVHEGTRPHTITTSKRSLYNRKTGVFFGKTVHHPGNKPNRFLPRMLGNAESKVQGYFREALYLATNEMTK